MDFAMYIHMLIFGSEIKWQVRRIQMSSLTLILHSRRAQTRYSSRAMVRNDSERTEVRLNDHDETRNIYEWWMN